MSGPPLLYVGTVGVELVLLAAVLWQLRRTQQAIRAATAARERQIRQAERLVERLEAATAALGGSHDEVERIERLEREMRLHATSNLLHPERAEAVR